MGPAEHGAIAEITTFGAGRLEPRRLANETCEAA
jgi:hypothetical protein